jgi:DNA topoisomerase-1
VKQLIHNGVLVPPRYQGKGFYVNLKGRKIQLNSEQEEMAVAWVKKLDTPHAKDKKFVKNFFKDFRKALAIKEPVDPEDFDFSEIQRYVEKEKNQKLHMHKDEKKHLAQSRKAEREANREKFGFALVDGIKVEVSNYNVEPPSIFIGRGRHPLRGRWKRGVNENDITLNLSPDAPRPKGNWKEIVWQPDSMWIAKWDDKLRGVKKYVWLSETSHIKQQREKEKFDQANALESEIEKLREYITTNLQSNDMKTRKIATVSFLIDALKLRVGDEKDKDEVDTVGATTLRPEHIEIKSNGLVVFDFLGKDSVRWHKEVVLPTTVVQNLKQFIANAQSSVFDGVRSEDVNQFFGQFMPNLTAKVFRTYHATVAVRNYLKYASVSKTSPNYIKKYIASMANLQAAIICNHKRKLPLHWHKSLRKKIEQMKKLRSLKTKKSRERVKILKVKIRTMRATRDYNLNTSLKSYIDPRVYYNWGKSVNFDWKLYYPKSLQRKFSWVEH